MTRAPRAIVAALPIAAAVAVGAAAWPGRPAASGRLPVPATDLPASPPGALRVGRPVPCAA